MANLNINGTFTAETVTVGGGVEGRVTLLSATGEEGIALKPSGNSGIELGPKGGTTATPYIDFHTDGTTTDYNSRILASGNDLQIFASSVRGLSVNGAEVLTVPIYSANDYIVFSKGFAIVCKTWTPSATGIQTCTFPIAFSSTPVVLTTYMGGTNTSTFYGFLTEVTTTTFNAKVYNGNSFQYLAWGPYNI